MIEFEYLDRVIRFVDEVGPYYKSHFDIGKFYEDDFISYVSALGLAGTYLDVGGNICNHSIYWALFSRSEQIDAFEPINSYRSIAAKNLLLNGVEDKVRLHATGLSDAPGHMTLRFQGEGNELDLTTLDNHKTPGPISVLKLDIEGMEPQALRGAKRMLAEHKPIIYCEVIQEENHTDYDDAEISAIIEPLGYVPTGRVFNYQPTVEFWVPDSPIAKALKGVNRRSIDLQVLKSNSRMAMLCPERETGALIRLDACSGAFVTDQLEDFLKPLAKTSERLVLQPDHQVFLEFEAYALGSVSIALIVNQYDDEELLIQDRIYVNRRKFTPIAIAESTTSIRLILDCKGTGVIDLRKLAITDLINRATRKRA